MNYLIHITYKLQIRRYLQMYYLVDNSKVTMAMSLLDKCAILVLSAPMTMCMILPLVFAFTKEVKLVK